MEKQWTSDAAQRDPAVLEAIAAWLESQARALWLHARDCDCWGLVTDADEARVRTREMRVKALICRANSAGLRSAGDDAQNRS